MPALDATDARVLLITHPESGASALARLLISRRLAACVSLVPVTSVYRWQGQVESGAEVLLVAKTQASRVPELERLLAQEHPYDVPELVALTPAHVEETYLAWLLENTGE